MDYNELKIDDIKGFANGFLILWSEPNLGYGEVTVSMKDGKISIDNECMSKEFNEKLFSLIK